MIRTKLTPTASKKNFAQRGFTRMNQLNRVEKAKPPEPPVLRPKTIADIKIADEYVEE